MHMTFRVVAIGMLMFLAATAPALAVGPQEGAYAVVESSPGSSNLQTTLVVLQEGTALGLALLFPEGFWVYGTGTLSPSNQIQGSLLQADGSAYGSFNLSFADGHVNGTIVEEGTTYSAAGQRIF
jgi:prepilin-type processing-associated H-X9-DG protein